MSYPFSTALLNPSVVVKWFILEEPSVSLSRERDLAVYDSYFLALA